MRRLWSRLADERDDRLTPQAASFGSRIVAAALTVTLVYLILTVTLPFALSQSSPGVAVSLNDRNPAALIALADTHRARLIASLTGDGRLPNAETKATPLSTEEIERLRADIQALARRALVSEPLNASAYRLLAETSADAETIRRHMATAARLSRHEAIAHLWLTNDALVRGDIAVVFALGETLLRTKPEVTDLVVGFLAAVAETPEGQRRLIERLAAAPPWRKAFLASWPGHFRSTGVPLSVFSALRQTSRPASPTEVAPYLMHLVRLGNVEQAYAAWLKLVPREMHAKVGLLTNGGFDDEISILPFDWQIGQGRNATVEIARSGQPGNQRWLRISFGHGRVRAPEISQVLFIGPGRYRLSGRFRPSVVAKRGLRWEITCLSGKQVQLGRTDLLNGNSRSWRPFDMRFEVPDVPDCKGQRIRAFHDARSASEEFIEGEVSFDDLTIERTEP